MLAGIELGGGLLHYAGTNVSFTDAKQWNAGAFFETQVSQHIHFRGTIGYTDYAPENGRFRFLSAAGDLTGVYGQIDLQHRLNQFIDYTLSGGRSISFAFFGGSIDLTSARLLANWRIIRNATLGTALEYEHGSQVAFRGEIFDRYGGNISLSRAITARAEANLGYQFYWRTSDTPGRNYTANIVSLNFSYRF